MGTDNESATSSAGQGAILRRRQGSLFACLLLTAVAQSACSSDTVGSYIGFWELSQDEDGSPKDTMEIRSDGTYVSHGWECRTSDVIPYHLHDGDMYATIEIPDKGPISIVFRLREDGRLSFTSPRSGNNAYYTRLPKNPCPGK